MYVILTVPRKAAVRPAAALGVIKRILTEQGVLSQCFDINLDLGHNGSWIMEFATPAISWLIARRQPGPRLDGTIFKSSRETLQEMKRAFQDLPDV